MKETIHLNIDDTQRIQTIAKALSSEQRLAILKKLEGQYDYLPAISITGGFANEGDVFKALALGEGYVTAVGLCTALGISSGLYHAMNHTLFKGLLFLAIEVAVIVYMVLPTGGIHWLSLLPSLGDKVQEEIWDEAQGIFVYVAGDNSNQILLYGVVTVFIIGAFIVIKVLKMKADSKMRVVMSVYYAVLAFKAASALNLAISGGQAAYWSAFAGAVLFIFSDTCLGFLYFTPVKKKNVFVTVELSTYYTAQILLAMSVALLK